MLEKNPNSLVLSVVSHGHLHLVQSLLDDLARECAGTVTRVVLTLNIHEEEPSQPQQGWPFVLQIRRNVCPLGFGANHNQALFGATESFVAVVNPDIRLKDGDSFRSLVSIARAQGACAYPVQLDVSGLLQNFEREIPTPISLLKRRLLGLKETYTDWVNAACLVMPLSVWKALNGFDQAYFMYCEDVDFCLRARLAGYPLVRAETVVEHAAQRASSRSWRHLYWHIRSLVRLWASSAFWRARHLLQEGRVGKSRIGRQ